MVSISIIIRNIIKFFTRKLMGTCQIERAAHIQNHIQFQTSIQLSKRIPQSLKQKIFSDQFNNDLLQQLCAFKNIKNKKSKSEMVDIINQIKNIFKAIEIIQQHRKTKYQKLNQQHQKLLLLLWNLLKPQQQLISRLSKQWIDIGFQDQDPSTDFRGAGFLGLINLVQYAKTQQGIACFKTASNKETEFFFCSAGLFMTIFCVSLLRQRKLDKYFYKCENKLLKQFQIVYNKVFNQFHHYWNQCQDKSMMSFNKNMETFKINLSSNIHKLDS